MTRGQEGESAEYSNNWHNFMLFYLFVMCLSPKALQYKITLKSRAWEGTLLLNGQG